MEFIFSKKIVIELRNNMVIADKCSGEREKRVSRIGGAKGDWEGGWSLKDGTWAESKAFRLEEGKKPHRCVLSV